MCFPFVLFVWTLARAMHCLVTWKALAFAHVLILSVLRRSSISLVHLGSSLSLSYMTRKSKVLLIPFTFYLVATKSLLTSLLLGEVISQPIPIWELLPCHGSFNESTPLLCESV